MALTTPLSITCTPRSDNGRIDTAFLDGNVTPSADVTASQAVPDSLGNAEGAFSLDSGQYFTGNDVGSGTISFVATVGSLAGIGLSVVSEDITGTGTEGAVTGRFSWTDGSETFITNTFTISFVATVGGSDTTAPTIPVGLSISTTPSPATITFDAPCDPHDGTNSGSGLDHALVFLDGVESEVDEIDLTATPGISPSVTADDVGTVTSGGGSRTGAGGTIIGDGFIGENSGHATNANNDEYRYEGRIVVTGNHSRSVKFVSLADSVNDYAKCMLQLRFGTGGGAPFINLQFRSGGGLRVEYRTQQDGERSTLGSSSISFPYFMKYDLEDAVFTPYISADGNNWIEYTEGTVDLGSVPGTFYSELAQCSTSDGDVTTTTYANDTYSEDTQISKTLDAYNEEAVTLKAVDASDNTSAASAAVNTTVPQNTFPLFPGFLIASYENASLSTIESRWQSIFTSTNNRKVTYRPAGVYGGVVRRLDWKRIYTNQSTRPTDPTNPDDAGYDWSLLDDVFSLNCVANEGALVQIQMRDIGFGGYAAPSWLGSVPYSGLFISAGGATRYMPRYDRYSGPDIDGRVNIGASPGIVDEYITMYQALYDHLVATGNINKVIGVELEELYGGGGGTSPPAGFNETNWYHGAMIRAKSISEIFEQSNIPVYLRSMTGFSASILTLMWRYAQACNLGCSHPDLKLNNTGNFILSRFTDYISGVYQKDIRPLMQVNEVNGERTNTNFQSPYAGSSNPWNASGSVTQTASHCLWWLSGDPTATAPNDDSGLGQSGTDPTGGAPVHLITLNFGGSSKYSASDWLTAIDTFGPPGTFAFPYLPSGYSAT